MPLCVRIGTQVRVDWKLGVNRMGITVLFKGEGRFLSRTGMVHECSGCISFRHVKYPSNLIGCKSLVMDTILELSTSGRQWRYVSSSRWRYTTVICLHGHILNVVDLGGQMSECHRTTKCQNETENKVKHVL